uniref:Uncharacterized protein n=1 Tax=Oryza punctata TaxID=4537 RepID=A0A0E0K2G3_ORYPU
MSSWWQWTRTARRPVMCAWSRRSGRRKTAAEWPQREQRNDKEELAAAAAARRWEEEKLAVEGLEGGGHQKSSGEAGAGWGEEQWRPGESRRRTAVGRGRAHGEWRRSAGRGDAASCSRITAPPCPSPTGRRRGWGVVALGLVVVGGSGQGYGARPRRRRRLQFNKVTVSMAGLAQQAGKAQANVLVNYSSHSHGAVVGWSHRNASTGYRLQLFRSIRQHDAVAVRDLASWRGLLGAGGVRCAVRAFKKPGKSEKTRRHRLEVAPVSLHPRATREATSHAAAVPTPSSPPPCRRPSNRR